MNETPLNCLLYADDLVILSSSESGLHSCLETLRGYTSKWRLQLNMKKSKVVIFGSKLQNTKSVIYQWKFGKELLSDIVDEYTYLRITLHYSGTLKLAQRTLYNKALKAYHSLLRNFSSVGSTPVKVLLKLFDCVVAPVLLYGCEVWGTNTLGKIASPQQLSSKFFSIIRPDFFY